MRKYYKFISDAELDKFRERKLTPVKDTACQAWNCERCRILFTDEDKISVSFDKSGTKRESYCPICDKNIYGARKEYYEEHLVYDFPEIPLNHKKSFLKRFLTW